MLARHYTTGGGGYAAAIFPLGEYGPLLYRSFLFLRTGFPFQNHFFVSQNRFCFSELFFAFFRIVFVPISAVFHFFYFSLFFSIVLVSSRTFRSAFDFFLKKSYYSFDHRFLEQVLCRFRVLCIGKFVEFYRVFVKERLARKVYRTFAGSRGWFFEVTGV